MLFEAVIVNESYSADNVAVCKVPLYVYEPLNVGFVNFFDVISNSLFTVPP